MNRIATWFTRSFYAAVTFLQGGVISVVWFCAYGLLVTVLLNHFFEHCTYDDPFITYRYAQNLKAGYGFVYNFGEQVLSTTTPLFALLLALLSVLSQDLPRWANWIGALSIASGALCLWDLASSWKTPAVGWIALFLYPTFYLVLVTLGSETPLYLAFCLAALAFYVRRHYLLVAFCVAGAVLTRPDGILLVLVLSGDYMLRIRRPIPLQAVCVLAGLLSIWFGFAWFYFGSPFPATLVAKQQQGAMAVSTRFLPGVLMIAGWFANWRYAAELAFAAVGVIALRQYREWQLLLVWQLFYWAGYSILGVSAYFWYYTPLVVGFLVLVGLGVAKFSSSVWRLVYERRRYFNGMPDRNRLFEFLAEGILIGTFFVFQISGVEYASTHPDQRYAVYRAVGEWLFENTPTTATVGSLEVGIIGYYSQRPMIDFAGLIQPAVAAQFTRDSTYEDTARWAIEHYKPAYLVLRDHSFGQLEQGYVARSCSRVKQFSGALYHYEADMSVYVCESMPGVGRIN